MGEECFALAVIEQLNFTLAKGNLIDVAKCKLHSFCKLISLAGAISPIIRTFLLISYSHFYLFYFY